MNGVRFAPSPTGRFHVGNLRTAWIAKKISNALRTDLIIRFEDIDKPRIKPGARESQLLDLQTLEITADKIYDQSDRLDRHRELFLNAYGRGLIYPCSCSRQEVAHDLAEMSSASHSGRAPTYSGKCRCQKVDQPGLLGWRFKMPNQSGTEDFLVGRASLIEVAQGTAKDYVPSYHWACAIDDMDGNYQVLVRAIDLAPATILQREIQKALKPDFIAASVFHTSLVVHDDGHRLEKRSTGVTLNELSADQLLESFEASFQISRDLLKRFNEQSQIISESRKKLTLKELLK